MNPTEVGSGTHLPSTGALDDELEPLTAVDASNLTFDADNQVNAFLFAGVLGHGGFVGDDGEIHLDVLRREVELRIAAGGGSDLRRLAQRVSRRGARWFWERCRPDLEWHVRRDQPVRGLAGLGERCAGLAVERLPADRPLWELLLMPIEGIADVAMVLRVHHAVGDGVGALSLVDLLFGHGSGTRPAASPKDVAHRPRRRRFEFARVFAMVRSRVEPTVLLGPIGGRHGVAFADVELEALRRAAYAVGGTINDALLAAVAGGIRTALESLGEPVPDPLPASVPVALPERGGSGNATGVMLVDLPAAVADRRERLRRIAGQTRVGVGVAREQGTYELTRSRTGARLMRWLARRQRFVAVFVTNVRGPERPLTIAGAPLLRAYPMAPVQGNVRLGVSALSYDGRLTCTIHTGTETLSAVSVAEALQDKLKAMVGTDPS